MKKIYTPLLAASLSASLMTSSALASGPSLVVTEADIPALQESSSGLPLFEAAMSEAVDRVARSMEEGIIVPTPVDPGGGYTHERHKENYKVIHDAGILYQITGDRAYLEHAQSMLLAYADMYEDLPLHPARRNQGPGRLFWQGLNESVWLVYTIQGFDSIQDDLDPAVRERIINHLLRPVADFMSTGSERTFRRIHNHGTWAAAAVGMTGYAIGDQNYVEQSLMGLDLDGSSGFLAQLSQLFSPDGYYTEGPYYQRYALMPFVLFAQAVQNNEPERGIFEFRDGILLKAIDATIQQSAGGLFFPINDAIREKGLDTVELVYGVAAAYSLTGDTGLLSIAEDQGTTVLTGDGLRVAQAVADGEETPFSYRSMILRDGPDGDQGGLGIFRMGAFDDQQTIVLKHTGQGLGHGHFDKLSIILYDRGREILADYGAARFLNVPSKDGGRYLPENTTWAKATIAHNTLVVNETSQFDSDWRVGQESWPDIVFSEFTDAANVVSAQIDDAYPGTVLTRTTLQIASAEGTPPLVLDLFSADASDDSTFDMPLYFQGQITDTSVDLERFTSEQRPFGDDNGYQHLWHEAAGAVDDDGGRFTWLNEDRFYTYHVAPTEDATASIVRTGANDPDFNLRSQQGIVLRVQDEEAVTFASLIETHGLYDPAAEFTVASDSQIASFEHAQSGDYDMARIETQTGDVIVVTVSHDPNPNTRHSVRFGGERRQWSGFYGIFKE